MKTEILKKIIAEWLEEQVFPPLIKAGVNAISSSRGERSPKRRFRTNDAEGEMTFEGARVRILPVWKWLCMGIPFGTHP